MSMSDVLDPQIPMNEFNSEEKKLQESLSENKEGSILEMREEAVDPDLKSDGVETQTEEEKLQAESVEKIDKLTKEEIIGQLKEIVDKSVEEVKNEVDSLKQAFYKLRRTEIEEAKKIFISEGGEEKDFQPSQDNTEEQLKELLAKFREKKSVLVAEEEKVKEQNLKEKKEILEELKNLIESPEDFNKIYNEFRRLQQRWKEIKSVPQANVNELWKDYQHYSEKFYDLLKINNEMRIYDFKKNLEIKTAICESVEKLAEEPDVVSAFHQLQKFHQDWRETGPVAKELREEIWARFKEASFVINKRHQDFFEKLREGEQENLEIKTAICEEIEAIDYDALKSFKDWDAKNKEVLTLQEKWKSIGFAPKKHNVKIFERFRAACDVFFQKKSDFYKEIKDFMEVNLEKKKALCEKAETMKDSTDWKETTEKFIALQKEWKTIGAVSRKYSDAVWKRFISACDYFFEQKNKNFSSQRTEESENLKQKTALIEKINAIDTSLDKTETLDLLKEWMKEWNSIGFVPFKEKDKIYKEYRDAVDKQFDRLKIDESERRLQSFKSNIHDIVGSDKPKGKLLGERERLMRMFEKLKSDIQTYENNIGFLSVSSKGGGGLVKDMNRKIESLKEELELIVKKIEAIDENLE